MYTLLLLVSMTFSSQGGMEVIKVSNLDYQTCNTTLAQWALGAEDMSGRKLGYTIEHSSCIPQAEVVK